MAIMRKGPPARATQSGASLIEVLVAALVLAIGALGVGAMQLTSLRNNHSAMTRSQAVIAMDAMMDSLRANAPAARINAYNMPMTCAAPTGTGRIDRDKARWITDLKAQVDQSTCGAITCASNVCTVTVRWDDSRATAGVAAQALTTVSRI